MLVKWEDIIKMIKNKTLIGTLLKYTGILSRFKELLRNNSELEKIIDDELISVIKEVHPSDYKSFIKVNESKLNDIRNNLKKKYTGEIKQRFSYLFPSIV